MSMGGKITHVVHGLDTGSPFAGSGRGVYGPKDLAAVKKAAKDAGIPITVREVPEDDTACNCGGC
jgi:hypothetical protein